MKAMSPFLVMGVATFGLKRKKWLDFVVVVAILSFFCSFVLLFFFFFFF